MAREGCPVQCFTAMRSVSISLHCKENLEIWRTPRPACKSKVGGESESCIEAEAEALDGAGAQAAGGIARRFVSGFDQDGVHLDVAFGDLKAGW
jgi:hypothetical protein